MKHIKLLTSLVTLSFVITSNSLVLTSCNKKKHENQEVIDYIYQRTFSLACTDNNQTVFGTCWIINDDANTDSNTYAYDVVTNWHVTHAFDNLGPYKSYYIADDSLSNRSDHIIDFNNYYQLNNYYEYPDKNFKYSELENPAYCWPGIDLHTCRINFGALPDGKIKNKLDNLRQYKEKFGYITKFANADDESIKSQEKYIGGYPLKRTQNDIYGGRWESHSIGSRSLDYYNKGWKFDGVNMGHAIGTPDRDQNGEEIHYEEGEVPEQWYQYDIAPQYFSNRNFGPDWMTGGSSGSMIVTEDCQVCGIYWGGWITSEERQFYPSFSLFKTNDWDFTKHWLDAD